MVSSSKSITWDPDIEGNVSKQIAVSARSVSSLKLSTPGSGSANVFLYDTASGVAKTGDLVWVLDAPSGSPDFNDFARPLTFYKGILAVLGAGSGFRPILNVAISPAPANPNPA